MKKIKNFKINIRQREVLRLLKATTPGTEVTTQYEEAIHRESERMASVVVPAAIYETFPKEKLPQELAAAAPERWVAASVLLVTVGDGVEKEINEAQRRGEKILGQILHAVALESLEQSGNFVQRLINEEAKDEACELSRQQRIDSPPGWDVFIQTLPGDKIGVQSVSSGMFNPMYSSGAIVYWTPLKKSKR